MAMIYSAMSSSNICWWADVNRKLDKAEEKSSGLLGIKRGKWNMNCEVDYYCMTNILFSISLNIILHNGLQPVIVKNIELFLKKRSNIFLKRLEETDYIQTYFLKAHTG